MAPSSYYVVYFDRGHSRFWNFNSTIRVHIVRAKSYVNILLNLSCVPIRVSVNKLRPERIVPGRIRSEILDRHYLGRIICDLNVVSDLKSGRMPRCCKQRQRVCDSPLTYGSTAVAFILR